MSWSAITPIGKRNSEWMVCPPTFSAATPVGAAMTTFFEVFQERCSSSVDLPVPARPVTKMWDELFSIAQNTAACSGDNSGRDTLFTLTAAAGSPRQLSLGFPHAARDPPLVCRLRDRRAAGGGHGGRAERRRLRRGWLRADLPGCAGSRRRLRRFVAAGGRHARGERRAAAGWNARGARRHPSAR